MYKTFFYFYSLKYSILIQWNNFCRTRKLQFSQNLEMISKIPKVQNKQSLHIRWKRNKTTVKDKLFSCQYKNNFLR